MKINDIVVITHPTFLAKVEWRANPNYGLNWIAQNRLFKIENFDATLILLTGVVTKISHHISIELEWLLKIVPNTKTARILYG